MSRPATIRAGWIGALAVLPLLPFVPGAISIDGPVFVAVSHQILKEPLDPFGFEMVWDPTSPEVAVFNRNPPLLSYYLAPFIGVLGERDWVLHAALLPFPLIAALAFLGIARRLCTGADRAAVLLVTTPAFVVLSTTLMLDVPTLGLLLAAVWALLRARDAGPGGASRWEWSAGALGAAAGLMKYVGFCGAPLLAAGVWLLLPRRVSTTLRVVGVPLAIWALWGAFTWWMYGDVHFLGSSDVVADERKWKVEEFWNHTSSVFVFYGGALVFPFWIWLKTVLRASTGIELAVAGVLLGAAAVTWALPGGDPPRRVPLDVEEAVIAALGFAGGFLLWVRALRPGRLFATGVDTFLTLWLGGLLVFTAFVNWHVNAADALFAAPPILLLLFRDDAMRPSPRAVWLGAGATLVLSLLLAWSDIEQANVYRTDAKRIAREIGDQPGARYCVGQWGLQHYLGKQGFDPVVPPMYGRTDLLAGDWLATARNVSQLDVTQNLGRYQTRPVQEWTHELWLPLRTTNADAGSGFYSHHSGYVPWAWFTGPLEKVQLGRVIFERR